MDADTGQELLDGLPAVCPYIYQLNTEVPGRFPRRWGIFYQSDWIHRWRKTKINYDFLSKFKYLACVRLSEIDSLEQMASLFKRSPYLVHFELADDAIHVTKNACKEHKLIYYNQPVFGSKNVDDLVNLLRFENNKLPPVFLESDESSSEEDSHH